MKIIAQVAPFEKIEHKGDLTIEGDIGTNATILIRDGSLVVNGDIASDAEILVQVRPELRLTNILSMDSGNSVSMINKNVIRGNSMMLGNNMVFGNGAKVVVAESISASMCINDKYIGNVNINNRIFTNAQVEKFGGGNYLITAPNDPLYAMFSGSKIVTGPVTATVDGVSYSGTKIRVEGTKVYVDDKIASEAPNSIANGSTDSTPKTARKVTIRGHIGDNVSIISDVCIIAATIGNNSRIISVYGDLSAASIGDGCAIKVRDAITLGNIGARCELSNSQNGIKAHSVGAGTVIDVRDAIQLRDIGDGCTLTSKMYGLVAGNIGKNVTVTVRDSIQAENIGNDSVITSTQYGIKAKIIGDNVRINVRDSVNLVAVGNYSVVTSQQNNIVVNSIGVSTTLHARGEVSIKAAGDRSQITSHQSEVKISGPTGSNVSITSRDSVQIRDIGDNAGISSSQGKVLVMGSIGINGSISARDDIVINGACPNPSSLKLQTRGKITKPMQSEAPVRLVVPSAPLAPDIYDEVDNYERDLELALEESRLLAAKEGFSNSGNSTTRTFFQSPVNPVAPIITPTSVNTGRSSFISSSNTRTSETGIFSLKSTAAEPFPKVKIPNAFLCPISLEIMNDPVILSLDNRSYERAEITSALTMKRESPITRTEMKPDQDIEMVLAPNRTLKEAIEEFRQDNPELFESDSVVNSPR